MENLDLEELNKQMEEDIKKEKGYIEIHLLLGEGENVTIPHITINHVGYREVANMILILETVKQELEDRFPESALFKHFRKAEISETQEKI